MFKPINLRVDYGKICNDSEYRIAENDNPVFMWAAIDDYDNAYQTAYKIIITNDNDNKELWKSGWCETSEQRAVYRGEKLPIGEKLYIELILRDNYNNESEILYDYFYEGNIGKWDATWICASEQEPRKAIYFTKKVNINKEVCSACFYVCGIGYHMVYLNGWHIDDTVLAPAHSDYSKICYYTVNPSIYDFKYGENKIEIVVGDGWRNNRSELVKANIQGRTIDFLGIPQLTAIIDIKYTDGSSERIITDKTWQWSYGAIQMNDIYDGETYDANSIYKSKAVKITSAPCEHVRPQILEPIMEKELYPAITIFSPGKGIFVADFGQNIAGVSRIKLPENMTAGQTITIKYSEVLNEDGTLYTAPLREAKCTDTYIASGAENDLQLWQPSFTYHGFRYAQIEGWNGVFNKSDITAVALYTDIKNSSSFTCGSPLVNQIHKNIVQTEKSNIHSILTDCPQRDERMGWMNDATVRFEETPYNFDIGRLFPKVIRDLLNTQAVDGSITCTAPYVFGSRPADPVCSSYLVAGLEALMHTGNLDIIREAYDGFAAWEDLLLSKSDNYIVNYSYYGDWASPAYACITPEEACSAVTPGIFMSTGYSYFNTLCLKEFAIQLKKSDDILKYTELSEKIKEAFMKKWWNAETSEIASGSQACQAFALWLGILPENERAKAAKVMRDNLVNNDYKITTGNLCTKYLFDMLAEYGYINDAWTLLNREDYPSYGYMIQNEATTIWERFELKKTPGMNSHNHPMYGAVGYWFYAYLCGIKILTPSCESVRIKPYLPDKLLSAQAVLDTVKGDITVKWVKRYGKTHLYVTVPFGVKAEIHANLELHTVGSGSYHYEW